MPDYLAHRVFVSAPGQLTESQLAAVFDFAQSDPRVEGIDGIICSEPA
jgi:hypothetical protein